MRQPRFAAIIFDADGTLIDSEVPGLDVIHQIATEHGLGITREAAHERFRGITMAEVTDWFVRSLPQADDGLAARLSAHIRTRMAERFRQGLSPMPGAVELLENLTLPSCVATNGPPEKVSLTLALSGLANFFEERVFSAYTVGSFKPDPGLFLHAAQALAAPPARCAVVEDSLPGVAAGVAAGMHVFALMQPDALPTDWTGRVTPIANLHALSILLQGYH
ncbi:MAG TPA: HAD-IA family hydrolase [Burkholderiaceae bacterium]|nr:HAD-IA family hydrolase [Burkholderiaceae bacterium]